MLLVETPYAHVALDEQGSPLITGTTMKIKELVAERLAWGWSAEELLINHPNLTLGQIYSALAYYADHQAEVDASIQVDKRYIETLRQTSRPNPLVMRLKTQGLV